MPRTPSRVSTCKKLLTSSGFSVTGKSRSRKSRSKSRKSRSRKSRSKSRKSRSRKSRSKSRKSRSKSRKSRSKSRSLPKKVLNKLEKMEYEYRDFGLPSKKANKDVIKIVKKYLPSVVNKSRVMSSSLWINVRVDLFTIPSYSKLSDAKILKVDDSIEDYCVDIVSQYKKL